MKRIESPVLNKVSSDNVNSAQMPTLSNDAPSEKMGDQVPSFSYKRPNPVLGPALKLGVGVGELKPELPDFSYSRWTDTAGLGTLGLLTGAAAGIIRSAPPGLYAATTGIQWFVLSSSFWGAYALPLNVQCHVIYSTNLLQVLVSLLLILWQTAPILPLRATIS